MIRKVMITLLCVVLMPALYAQNNFQKDLDFYWQTIHDNFAYFHRQKTDWVKVKLIYQPIVDTINNKPAFIRLLEMVNNELYNGHIFLNTNTPASNRIIPSGADLKVEWLNKKFLVTELRQGYNAEECDHTEDRQHR